MLDRLRNRLGLGSASSQRHMTRREQEHRQRQILILLTSVAAVVVILALVIGAVYQYYWFPRQTVAAVNGSEIRQVDYIKLRQYLVRQEIARVAQQLQGAQAETGPQLQATIEELQAELDDLENNRVNPHPETVEMMIEDRLVVENLSSLGIMINDAEVTEFALEILAPAPLGSPTPTVAVDPTALVWATATTEAFDVQITQTVAALSTSFVQQTAEAGESETEGEPTGTAVPEGTPEAEETAEPTATFEPTPTMSPDDARRSAEANYEALENNFLEPSGMSRGDFERLIVEPALARQRAQEQLATGVEPRADQAHLSHILVATEEAAQEVMNRLEDEEFSDLASEVSIDTQSAARGGDLGWGTANTYVDEFSEAAFALEPGEISEPVQSQFGWHIIMMIDFEEDRPLTVDALNQERTVAFSRWVQGLLDSADIETDVTLPSQTQG